MIKNTRRRSLCKPLEIEFNNNFFLCKLLRAVTSRGVMHLGFSRIVHIFGVFKIFVLEK